MKVLRTTLLSDGSSDRALLPILDQLLQSKVTRFSLQGTQWADPRNRRTPLQTLEERIRFAVDYYPSDILFIHRDAEAQAPKSRREEIAHAVDLTNITPPSICVVPVRMTEAWLLLDEMAIRRAAGNPGGKVNLNLPLPQRIESLPDPKELLFQTLKTASELGGRRLRTLRVNERRHRVAELMNWELLRELAAFQQLENELTSFLTEYDWV
jgi:hypothetical protein